MLVVTTLISAGYYLPVVMAAYMREPLAGDSHDAAALSRPAIVTTALAIGLVLALGVLPSGTLASALETAATVVQDGSASLAGSPR